MATLVCNSDANFTAANVWDVVDTTGGGFRNSEAGNTAVTTGNHDSISWPGAATTYKGICMKVHSRVVTPTGTVTVTLRNVTDSVNVISVTVNVSDICEALAGTSVAWVYFRFASDQTLSAAKTYLLRVTASVSNEVTFFTDGLASSWSQMMVKSNTATIASGDIFHVLGELTGIGAGSNRTITMDSTSSATSYGSTTHASTIGHRGTLTWASSAATNYVVKHAGIIEVGVGGAWNQGTVATPCPRDSTMKMMFASTSLTSTAYLHRRGGTVVMQGQSRTSGKNVVQCNVTSDLAAAGTTLNVNTDTGWLSGDEICITPTARTVSEGEKRTLSGNAGASSMTITAGVTYAHSASRLFNCKIGLLTRNVTIENDNTAFGTELRSAGNAGSLDCDWVQFKHGDNFSSVYINAACTQELDYCSATDSNSYGFRIGTLGSGTISVRNAVIWNPGAGSTSYSAFLNSSSISGATITLTDNVMVAGTVSCVGLSIGSCVTLGAITGNFVAGFSTGMSQSTNTAAKNTAFSLDSNTVVVCFTGFNLFIVHTSPFVITGIKAYHCTNLGIALNSCRNLTFNNAESHGSVTGLSTAGTAPCANIRLNNFLTGGTTGFTQTTGVNVNTFCKDVTFKDTVFSASGGGKEPSTNEVAFAAGTFGISCEVTFNNPTKQNIAITSTAAPGTISWDQNAYISFARINGTSDGTGDYTVMSLGKLEYDASVYKTAAPSLKMTSLLGTSTQKMQSAPQCRRQTTKVASGATSTVSVWARTSAAYNGAQPRLMVAANAAAGITSDTAIDTMTVGTATWEELTGTTATVSDDCELEFYVDCDGTAGYVNVDDWTIDSKTNDMSVWVDGLPTTEMTSTGGGSTGVARSRLFDKKG